MLNEFMIELLTSIAVVFGYLTVTLICLLVVKASFDKLFAKIELREQVRREKERLFEERRAKAAREFFKQDLKEVCEEAFTPIKKEVKELKKLKALQNKVNKEKD